VTQARGERRPSWLTGDTKRRRNRPISRLEPRSGVDRCLDGTT